MELIHCRIIVYVLTIILHIGNTLYMNTCFTEEAMKYKIVRNFYEVQFFFFTCWSFTFQTLYSMMALYTDVMTLKSTKSEDKLPKSLTDLRDEFFAAIVWPSNLLVFSIFWPTFLYDRNLFYPEDIDKAITYTSNHIMHTWIVVASFWEIFSRFRSTPRSHKWRIITTFIIEIIYIIAVVSVYLYKGIWVYPILGRINNSIYFYIFYAWVAVLLTIIYHSQWILMAAMWSSKRKIK